MKIYILTKKKQLTFFIDSSKNLYITRDIEIYLLYNYKNESMYFM
jgi:hypothetical protein